MDKIEYNKKMIGKRVIISQSNKNDWVGSIIGIESEEVFIVENQEGKTHLVDIFDIRSVDGNEEKELQTTPKA